MPSRLFLEVLYQLRLDEFSSSTISLSIEQHGFS